MKISNTRLFVIAGLLVAFVLALVVSPFANPNPDGLNRVAEDEGFARAETDHTFADGPLSDYALRGVEDEHIAKGLSGVIGIVVTFVLGLVLFGLLRNRHARGAPRRVTEDGN